MCVGGGRFSLPPPQKGKSSSLIGKKYNGVVACPFFLVQQDLNALNNDPRSFPLGGDLRNWYKRDKFPGMSLEAKKIKFISFYNP